MYMGVVLSCQVARISLPTLSRPLMKEKCELMEQNVRYYSTCRMGDTAVFSFGVDINSTYYLFNCQRNCRAPQGCRFGHSDGQWSAGGQLQKNLCDLAWRQHVSFQTLQTISDCAKNTHISKHTCMPYITDSGNPIPPCNSLGWFNTDCMASTFEILYWGRHCNLLSYSLMILLTCL